MGLSDRKVDIIIPIYNAFDELVRCFESVVKWTDLTRNRLILVNDNSPDERVYQYLEEVRKEHIIVIHNDRNKGFSANINLGMAQSEENDVILLNSDTVVTRNWVEKLEACAYSDCSIATVTPLSNNATLCSVPNFCEENKVPDGYTVDEYAELIERISLKRYPKIPVAHGFCMYVKREVINKIGNFDAETFQRGYGEENDFCSRATEAGYHHVMCDNTFILHTGTSSFVSEEKQKYIAEHEKIIDTRYPDLNREVQIHCRDNPNAMVSENVRFWIDYARKVQRKTMMYLVQSDFRADAKDNVGGTQLHVKDLTNGMRSMYDILVAARNDVYLNVTLYTENKEFFFKYYIGEEGNYRQFRSARFAGVYRKILNNFGVDCVHIHHTKGLSLELFYEAEKRGIPVFATIHDYYYLCPNAEMVSNRKELCIGKEVDDTCKACLRQQMGIIETLPYLSIWREEHLRALKCAEKIFVPSFSTQRIITDYFGELRDRIIVVEHGIQPIDETSDIPDEKRNFHVAFLGGINIAKGYQNAVELIKKSDKKIRWHLFGAFEREDAAVERKRNFINVGRYQREELPLLMKKYSIDLVCILPICSETFCYTLSETVSCGIPVLVTDTGALGERVRKMDCGWVVPADAAASDILAVIDRLKGRGEEYRHKLERVRGIKIKTVEEMCQEYQWIYDEYLAANSKTETCCDNKWLLSGIMSGVGRDVVLQEDTDETIMRLEDMERQIYELRHSFAYRAVKKIAKIKIPFRRQIKAVIYKAYERIRKRK